MVRFSGRIACRFASAAAVFAIAGAVAQAAPITIGLSTTTGAYYGTSTEGTGSGQTLTASGIGENATFICDWSVSFDHDPFYLANFTITNTSALTQQFTLNVSLPVSPAIPGSSVMGGYFGELSYSDANLSGAVKINTVGSTDFFVAKIDGVGVEGIGSFIADLTGGPAGIGGTIPYQAFGAPIPSLPGPAVNTSIGGTVVFELSPGDRTSFPIYFQVDPVGVPEPTAALLVGLGVLGLAAIRQRRS